MLRILKDLAEKVNWMLGLGLFGHVMSDIYNVNCMCRKKYNFTPL